ncbi:hypothetical protein [Oceanobacillus bengalensis]|uniref:Uncharacterized protein n=1 Tax=Oceanobacillus bengalensis TaxID=1435466 RepID=A0A494Z1H6_9BACI|nr:hypothetical protein [Oceanobacillus bengalensis]RKQ16382.1 hypothetical protein D8M05_07835 [Oceanobacillus bengalensis]
MRKTGILVVILIVSSLIIGYAVHLSEAGSLITEKAQVKQVGDFILHMKVEKANNGINVFQSLQYVGEEPIEIEHQTPLISVSLGNKNHDFTGSMVSKRLEMGNIYRQEKVKLLPKVKGESDLHMKANFHVEGEKVTIEHVEKLIFE